MSVEKFRRTEEAAGKELNFIPEKSERMGLRRDRRTVADGMIGNVGKFEFEKERQKSKAEEKRQENKNVLTGGKRK